MLENYLQIPIWPQILDQILKFGPQKNIQVPKTTLDQFKPVFGTSNPETLKFFQVKCMYKHNSKTQTSSFNFNIYDQTGAKDAPRNQAKHNAKPEKFLSH